MGILQSLRRWWRRQRSGDVGSDGGASYGSGHGRAEKAAGHPEPDFIVGGGFDAGGDSGGGDGGGGGD
jgi:hypothetical protein